MLPDFSAAADKGAVTYHQWRKAVHMALFQGHREKDLILAMYASLKGLPGELLRCFPMNTPLPTILHYLDDYYGEVRSADLLMQHAAGGV